MQQRTRAALGGETAVCRRRAAVATAWEAGTADGGERSCTAVCDDLHRELFAAAFALSISLMWSTALASARIEVARVTAGTGSLSALGARPDNRLSPPAQVSLPAARPAAPDRLTPRELEVLRLIAAGMTNPQIAALLVVSTKTVMHHSVNIYRKIQVRGRAGATAYAIRTGLAGPEIE